MFMATIFGISRPYSSKENANRSLALFLQKNQMGNVSMSLTSIDDDPKKAEIVKLFKESMAQENYEQAICCWNDYARLFLYHNTAYLAEVLECEIDQPFT